MANGNIIYVHGLNTANPFYHKKWSKNIPESSILKQHIVKWDSWSWEKDLFRIYMSKVYRDKQIQKVIDKITECKDEPTLIIPHSWGTVWTYKAWNRMNKAGLLKNQNIWIVMVGAALGGTNLPFGGVYIKKIQEQYRIDKTPPQIQKLFNIYNDDDYVSSRIYMDRMENLKIDVGGFHPGMQEHDATIYFKTMEFRYIMQSFMKTFNL